jgi:hypothetical protein
MELGALTPEPAGQPISPDHLHHHLKRHGIQTRQLRAAGAAAWVLDRPAVTSLVISARTAELSPTTSAPWTRR